MFATLKNKIKEETGKEVAPLPVRMGAQGRLQRSAFGSATSSQFAADSGLAFGGGGGGGGGGGNGAQQYAWEQRELELAGLRLQCSELQARLDEATQKTEALRLSGERLEQSNRLLEESLKVAQMQKDLYQDEQDKIQNIQLQEIAKLKGLLNFREQEAVDQLAQLKQHQQTVEQLKAENQRLRVLEAQHDDIQDEYEKLQHSAQLERNAASTAMAVLEEQTRHLHDKVHVLQNSHAQFTGTLNRDDEQVQRLLAERRILEQRLEEAHLHLSDIKSTWSAQNLALETQVSRLSHQVAAETTEKRRALHSQDDQVERLKQVQFELEKARAECEQRDSKIRLLTEEIDDLNGTLNELRSENDEEVQFLRSKVKQTEEDRDRLRARLDVADLRVAELSEQNDEAATELRQQTQTLRDEVQKLTDSLESETAAHRTTALKNAQISQDVAKLKQSLNDETSECAELTEAVAKLSEQLASRELALAAAEKLAAQLTAAAQQQQDSRDDQTELHKEIAEKTKEIKILKQRLVDFKKTLQDELKSAQQPNESALIDVDSLSPFSHTNGTSGSSDSYRPTPAERRISNSHAAAVAAQPPSTLDEVNFMYLKHVIMKFLTCRDIEARQLVRAVATLLHLNKDEEKLLAHSVEHKAGWFSIKKPDPNGIII